MTLADEAKQFLRSTRSAVLSTISAQYTGYPFGSVAPFILDHALQPIILISTIAEHTKNILANPKVSLMVFAGHEDLQASSRLTLMGDAVKIQADESSEVYTNLRARYCRYFPESVGYFAMHDFHFYRINIHQIRYIAGFGKMGWLDGAGLNMEQLIDGQLAKQETSIVDHMNADHADSMRQYCQHFHQISAINVQMLGLDSAGFDVKATLADHTQKFVRFEFDQVVTDAQSARVALVAMSKAARAE